jgi:type I restriction enzyme, R subunit
LFAVQLFDKSDGKGAEWRLIGAPEEMERIREEGGRGVFVRSVVGLDRAAAKRAFDTFIQGRKLTVHEREFADV